MAEPVYPSLEEGGNKPIGFEGIIESTPEPERVRVDDKRLTSGSNAPAAEEIQLLTSEERKQERDTEDQDTVYFKDGVRKIDICLTYKDLIDAKKGKGDEEARKKSSAKRADKRKAYFEALERKGLQFEYQDPKYYDGETWFVKVHATFPALEKGAEDLLIRMPIQEVDLPRREKSWYRDIFSTLHIRDPFEFFDPKVPKPFQHADFFTAPYVAKKRANFHGSDDEANFFSSAQRSFIVWNILENTQYGPNEDQVGVSRLVQNSTFTSAFFLHDGDFTKKNPEDEIDNERQLLHYEWSHPKNFYKYQPLENIRHYFGEKIGLYFAWVGFYTSWLGFASIVGIIVMIAGLFTLSLNYNELARDICNDTLRAEFYMCPLCDETCDFWYYRSACGFARVSLLFDYGGTVFFAAFMACYAVLFLEFWKRTEKQLQYQWDTLGFEEAEQRERPEFVQAIKKKIKNYPEEKKKQYKIKNPVLERYEYIQPAFDIAPKLVLGFVILITMVIAVLGVVFAVLIYRLAVSTSIYRLVQNLPGGPSVADLTVSITGSLIQLVFIVIMNQVYERLATWLTSWELHRTTTEYEDSFTFKMYLFQFINFYTSIFYIAFIKGKFTGYPGGYDRIGSLRLDECSAYGCLLELTIQLAIIFLGKQVLNDISELGVPYAKTILKKVMRYRKEKGKDTEEDDSFVRWEKDFELIPLSIHGLFFEYLELVIQYGFVTIFVAAFPLAPFFAWVNNVIEIRLDAHKFIQVFRRPLAERAQDIGLWFHLLRFVTNLSVVTNALLIAFTSQFIDRELFDRVYKNEPEFNSGRGGFVRWATSSFSLTALLQSATPNGDTNFPVYTAQSLLAFDGDGNEVTVNGQDQLYLPFIDFDCVARESDGRFNATSVDLDTYRTFYENRIFRNLTLNIASDRTNENSEDFTSNIRADYGICFNTSATCRFRGQVDPDGEFPLEYWRLITVKLSFVIVFEHFIFILGILLDWLVPDIPKSVEDEIRREKLLASKLAQQAKEEDARGDRDRTYTEASLSAAP
ncbi:PREDICTED: anoctamin-7-like isoform X1 [Amphimedon queenslandica]|uniref:Anoctamin n=1 Tax=Amphimedon queenslandica TaxID=400682 RepID=A0AAN0JV72_AMPQE|nr:PREDICTED: anoctamin-7-like isoform X1 [Amphimedon queenslandica]|eukprot:XP_019861048.1 PREDICTED: anoctamin-7-like isoform X1 [Amphimedon queenslandica]